MPGVERGSFGVGIVGVRAVRVPGRVVSWVGGPSGGRGDDAEHGETREVGGSGEEVEVGVDFVSAADAGSSPAVAASHEMREFPFDFGPVGAVVGLPVGIGLTFACPVEGSFIDPDPDRASGFRGSAFATEWTGETTRSEASHTASVVAAADRDGHIIRTRDSVSIEVHRGWLW